MSNNFPSGFKRRAQSAESTRAKAIRLLSSKWMLNTSNMKFCKVDSCYLVLSTAMAFHDNVEKHRLSHHDLLFSHKGKLFYYQLEPDITEVEIRRLFCENKKLLVSCRTSKAYGNYAIIRNPVTMPKNAHELEIVE